MDNEEAKTLLNLVAMGDQIAFSALYRGQSRMIFAFVFNQLNSLAESEEVVSETMFDVWKGAAKFRGESSVRTWILGIARNKMLMKFRARVVAHDDIDDYGESIASDEPDVVALIAETQRAQGVQRCMAKLTLEHRECLHLLFFEGSSVAEISGVQNVPIGTVKTRLHHARLKIKSCLANLLRDEGGALEGV